MIRLLLVEDDHGIARFVTRGLAAEGWLVDWRRTASSTRSALAEGQDYAAAILDLVLPDGDGLDLCRTIHGIARGLPILMLTARGALDDRLDGFRAGADDYLPKPFAFEELVARLAVLIRRGEGTRRPRLACGALSIDTVARIAMVAEEPLALRAREFAVLACLVARAETTVDRATLIDEAWGIDAIISANNVDVHVGYVRRVLSAHAAAPRIETVRGVGFRLVSGAKDPIL